MKLLAADFDTAAEQLACDEVLLDWCDELGEEVLRVWEPQDTFVVLGCGNRVSLEVNQAACAEVGARLYRRSSGGGCVLQGPGCLNYSLVLPIPAAGPLATIPGTNAWIMERHRHAAQALIQADSVVVRGHTDLAIGERKFSGNAQRRKRRALLFHGTFLYSMDVSQVGRFLKMPSQQPAYRQGRSHKDFMTNLPLSAARLRNMLAAAWRAEDPLERWPIETVSRLATAKYEDPAWTLKY